jgi:FKBP-type peptidyl-prolyl cis-trans isomerase SlyD
VGMAAGDRKQFKLQPHEAYGEVDPKLIRQIPRAKLPKRLVIEVGKRLTAVRGSARRRRRVTVVEIRPDSITVDGNHPLAGQIVELEVSLLTLDSSGHANKQRPQFDLGGQG